MTTPALQSSDTWILVALLHATEDHPLASLGALVRAADAVNHAIISHGELEGGFTRLVPLGHATAGPDGYAPSEGIRAFWMTKTKGWRSTYKSWEQLGVYIGASNELRPAPKVATERYVTKAAYEQAIAGYAVNTPHPLLGK